MITEDEIKKVTKLMKIDVYDHKEYVEKVHAMLNYFDILDSANVEDEEILVHEALLNNLRKDEHISFNDKLIEKLKNYKGSYVRSPKMM